MNPIQSMDKCTTCTTCVASCPVTRAAQKYRGPKLTGPAFERFRLLHATLPGPQDEIEGLDYCSNCKNCDIVCPSGVNISTLNMLARAEWCRKHKPSRRDWLLAHGTQFGVLARLFPNLLVHMGFKNPVTRQTLDLLGISRHMTLPVFAHRSFRQLFNAHPEPEDAAKEVVFFPGCYIEHYDPQPGMDLVYFLERAGYRVLVPELGCCGVPLIANGFMDEAAMAAERNTRILAALSSSEDKGLPILTLCSSCALMLAQEYGEFFPNLTNAQKISPRIEDASEFLINLIENGELNIKPTRNTERLIYHAPCHLRAMGIGKPGLELLRMAGANIEDAQAGCCGLSGSYGFKKEKYAIAAAIGHDLFQAVADSGATQVISDCGTCRLQISHHTGVPAIHPVSRLRALID